MGGVRRRVRRRVRRGQVRRPAVLCARATPGLESVDIDEADDERLGGEPGAVPDVLDEFEDGRVGGYRVARRRPRRRRQLLECVKGREGERLRRQRRQHNLEDIGQWLLRVCVLAEERVCDLALSMLVVVRDPPTEHARDGTEQRLQDRLCTG
jgi:hypothetical protein